MSIKAPFPWFGGKSRVAPLVWQRFGNVSNYVEPFFGSGAVLLGRPGGASGIETVNDKDGFLSNFWRALQADPDAVARWADWPVNENDLHARHAWLVEQRDELTARLEGCPDYYDVKIAGWWVWGIACWIGSGWCSGKGPWLRVDGLLVNNGDAGRGVNRQLPHLGSAGQGVNRKQEALTDYFAELADRLRGVRVCCGDWARITGPTVTEKLGVTAVFLDPPYTPEAGWFGGAYSHEGNVAHDVAEWCRTNGDNPALRIALCGYEGEHDMPENWTVHAWKTRGGYGSQAEDGAGRLNAARERIWFSPHCLPETNVQQELAI